MKSLDITEHITTAEIMGKKQRFAVVPEDLILKGNPIKIAIYCEIYLIIISGQKYNLKSLCENKGWSYNIAYKLKRLVIKQIEKNPNNSSRYKVGLKSDKITTKKRQIIKPITPRIRGLEKIPDKITTNNRQNTDKPTSGTPVPVGLSEALIIEIKRITNTNTSKLLSREQIMVMPRSERMIYIAANERELKNAGII
tara:strand:+ start:12350 stop:12940 length:591 start_codon:yes stop_codon:yes gene_type:complete